MALRHLRHAPLALRLARLPPLASASSSSPATRLLFLLAPARPWRLLLTAGKPRSLATVAAAEADDASAGGGDGFFAEDGTSWKSLGISDRLASALHATGLARPSLVQAACIPHVLTTNDVIVAAETGSGKTHGYLVPLIKKLCSKSSSTEDGDPQNIAAGTHNIVLVLCPNVMLCEQVVSMANSLLDMSGEPLKCAAVVCGPKGWPAVCQIFL